MRLIRGFAGVLVGLAIGLSTVNIKSQTPLTSSSERSKSTGLYLMYGGASAGYSPADTTPYYWGQFSFPAANPSTTAPTGPSSAVPIVRAPTTITDVYLSVVVGGTLGTTETGTLAIVVNNTTTTTIFNNTVQHNTILQGYTANNFNLKLNPGDWFALKFTPPAWATNPTAVFYEATFIYTNP